MAEDKKVYAVCEGCKSLKETMTKEQINNAINAHDNFSKHIKWYAGGTSQTFTVEFEAGYAFGLLFTSNGGLYLFNHYANSIYVKKISDTNDLTITFVDAKTITIQNTDYTRFTIVTGTNYKIS